MVNLLYGPTLTSMHDYWKKHSFDYTDQTFVSQVMSLLFNTLCSFVIAVLPRSKHLLITIICLLIHCDSLLVLEIYENVLI